MPTDITSKTIAKAKADAKLGRINITDARGRGLVLRGGPEGLVWGHRVQLDGNPFRLVLGTVDRWSVAEARAIADAASDFAKSHKVPPDEEWLLKHLAKTGKIDAPAVVEAGGEFPTFAEGRTEYLTYAKDYISAASLGSYKTSLFHPRVQSLHDRRLPTITRDDIMEIVNDVHRTHERTAELIISAIRPMFNYFGEDGRRRLYGVEPGIMIPLKNPKRKLAPATSIDEDDDEQPWSPGYVPEISELGRIIAVARSGIIQPIPAGAVELVCWTVQRRRAIVTARLQDFFKLENGEGGLWRIPAGSRKGKTKRPHTIPLPPVVWACVEKAAAVALKKDPKTRYLFPGARPRRIGMPVTHLNQSTAGHLFADIPGCGATMHDVRRAMGTHGEQLIGLSRLDTGYVMDHEASVRQSDRITSRTAGTGTHDVTGVHYSLHDGSHHSWPVMRAWSDAIEKAVAEATAALDLKQLAREFGEPEYRIGAKPGIPLAWTGQVLEGEERKEFDRKRAAVRGRVVALGVADDDED